jgi:hypothetical protein
MIGSTKVRNMMGKQVDKEIKDELRKLKIAHCKKMLLDDNYLSMVVSKTAEMLIGVL